MAGDSKAQTFFKWAGIVIAGILLLGPIIGPVVLAMNVDARYEIPDQFLGTIELDCGSVFSALERPRVTDSSSWEGGSVEDTPALRAEFKEECESKLNSQKGVGIALTVIGGVIWVVLIAAWIKTGENPVEFVRRLRSNSANNKTADVPQPPPATP